MPRPITIRAAGPAEAEVVWRLTVEAYRPERERLHPPSRVFKETVPDVQRAMDEGTVYVAQRGADVVGTVRVRLARDQDALYCGRLAVLPAARRWGIGTALMERVERHACEALRLMASRWELFWGAPTGRRTPNDTYTRHACILGHTCYARVRAS